jgi:hypothetical protein
VEEDDDERVFANLQRAAAASLPVSQRRTKARKDTFVKVPLWVDRAGHQGDADAAGLRLYMAVAPLVAGKEHDVPSA